MASITVPSAAQSTLSPDATPSPSSSMVLFGEKFQTAQRAPAQQTRLFIYRLTSAATPAPVNIYLDGRFHTALLNAGYSEFCAAPGQLSIQSAYDDAQKMHAGKEGPGTPWTLKAGQTLYLRVNESQPTAVFLQEVAPELGKKELPRTATQIHVLSRAPAVHACDSPAPIAAPAALVAAAKPAAPSPVAMEPVAKPHVPRSYALQTDALFEFGKTELKVSGYNAIEIMAQRLKRDFSQVDRIRVVGHSDAIGQAKRNRALSLARAEVVTAQLRERGVKALHGYKVEGQGADALVKTDCPHRSSPASKLCHAPNRRVEIIVYGAKN